MKLYQFISIFLLFGSIFAEEEDPLEDVQTEFYLPYSVTEDVDFSLSKPSGFGCYQWYIFRAYRITLEVYFLNKHLIIIHALIDLCMRLCNT